MVDDASKVLRLHYRAFLIGNVSRIHTSRNPQDYLAQSLDKQIKLVESKALILPRHPGIFHSILVKTGEGSDQLLCKQLRFYASSGCLPETVKFFNDCYFSNKAGLGVWNTYIISLALHAQEDTSVEYAPKPLTVFEDMPMVKTHATFWNAMVVCSETKETKYAQYLLGKVFKVLAVEPSIEITGSYIDALARSGQVEKAFTEVKGVFYKVNQEMVVSLLCRYKMHSTPAIFANEVLRYVESQGVVFYIDKSTYRQLTEDGVTLNPNVRIKRQRKRITSAIK